jgi:hypothetical protein
VPGPERYAIARLTQCRRHSHWVPAPINELGVEVARVIWAFGGVERALFHQIDRIRRFFGVSRSSMQSS